MAQILERKNQNISPYSLLLIQCNATTLSSFPPELTDEAVRVHNVTESEPIQFKKLPLFFA